MLGVLHYLSATPILLNFDDAVVVLHPVASDVGRRLGKVKVVKMGRRHGSFGVSLPLGILIQNL